MNRIGGATRYHTQFTGEFHLIYHTYQYIIKVEPDMTEGPFYCYPLEKKLYWNRPFSREF